MLGVIKQPVLLATLLIGDCLDELVWHPANGTEFEQQREPSGVVG